MEYNFFLYFELYNLGYKNCILNFDIFYFTI